MSRQLDQLKTAYSGWHAHSNEIEGEPAKQLDMEAEIERRVAERLATEAALKKAAKAAKAKESAE